eukprot:889550-Pelagomonas_calceolata.AAC.1
MNQDSLQLHTHAWPLSPAWARRRDTSTHVQLSSKKPRTLNTHHHAHLMAHFRTASMDAYMHATTLKET